MPIKGITGQYRPQRQGKIHLGIKAKKPRKDGKGFVEYPAEVDYFVLYDAKELIPIYKDKPKSLNISLPSTHFDTDFDSYLEKVFPQYLKRYTAAGLWCKGDGEIATEVNAETGGMDERECPCDYMTTGECRRIGIFRFRIQEIPTFNIYQITTSSYNSIINLNSFIRDLIEHCSIHRIDPSDIKLILRRKPEIVQRAGDKGVTKSTHHILVLDLDPRFYRSLDDVRSITPLPPAAKRKIGELPAPDETRDTLFFPDKAQYDAAGDQKSPSQEELDANEARRLHDAAIEKQKMAGAEGHWEPDEDQEKEKKKEEPKKKKKPPEKEAPKPAVSEEKEQPKATPREEKPKKEKKAPEKEEESIEDKYRPDANDADPAEIEKKVKELNKAVIEYTNQGGIIAEQFKVWLSMLPAKNSVMAYKMTIDKMTGETQKLIIETEESGEGDAGSEVGE